MKVDEEGSMRFGGRVTVFEPSRELTFEDRWLPADDSAATSLLTIRLTPALGGTLVELIDHGFERLDGDVAEVHRGYEAAWDLTQLNALQDLVSA